jgi:hypothetical protein
LVEAGLLDLDKPLYGYLPYPDISRDPRYRKITARMALSHTAGFPNWRNGDSLRITFAPGQRWSYSGEGYVYLQKVVEKISGKPLNEVMTEQVFKPLGMTRSSYVWREAFNGNTASPHDAFGNPKDKDKPVKANAAFSLQTTAPDYAAFVAALLNGTGLKKETIEAMFTSQVRVPEDDSKPDPGLSEAVSWGLGVGLQQPPLGGKAFWHWGDNFAFKCYVAAYPEEKTGVIYFTNSYNGLSIASDMLRATTGGAQPAIDILAYEKYTAPGFLFKKNIFTQGVTKAIEPFLDASRKSTIEPEEMHRIGHQLAGMGKVQQAKEVFRLNLEAHPESADRYEGYAYACLVNGQLTEAAENYQKALKLNPQDKEAKTVYDGIMASRMLKGNTQLKLKGYADARLVAVAGTFNDWFPFTTFFVRQGDAWVCKFDLAPGKYQYKVVVDGKWMLDPANAATAVENGHTNSLLVVK